MLLQAAAADTDLVAAAADTDLVLAYCIVHLQTVLQDDVTLIRRRFLLSWQAESLYTAAQALQQLADSEREISVNDIALEPDTTKSEDWPISRKNIFCLIRQKRPKVQRRISLPDAAVSVTRTDYVRKSHTCVSSVHLIRHCAQRLASSCIIQKRHRAYWQQ